MYLSFDNLVSDARSLSLLALGISLPRECGNFNKFERCVRYLWCRLLLAYICNEPWPGLYYFWPLARTYLINLTV